MVLLFYLTMSANETRYSHCIYVLVKLIRAQESFSDFMDL